ncbi:MAG TPA: type II secretion system protein [Candidatus Saccharimonadia bacterium]
MSNLLKKEKGFTLIEIVLVLAIAGLILVIVFLAVSGAQKSRRDTQRKNDNARLLSQLESYASNNNGAYPTTGVQQATFTTTYLPSNFNDPTTGGQYNIAWTNTQCPAWGGGPATDYIIINGRQVTTRMCLEQGQQDLTNQ